MFPKRHKKRLTAAAMLFIMFFAIGGAAQPVDITSGEPAPVTSPDAGLSASALRQEVRECRTASFAASLDAETVSDTIPAVIVEETVLVEPEAAAPVPYLSYYEQGHFQPGENGVLVTDSGEELRYSSVLSVSATAYTTERQENKITATGTVAHVGGIAVDPTVIPYGTKMYIISETGSWSYGHAVAEDCGGGIKGNKIDLFFDTYDECIQFGVRNALVYILEE